MYSHAVWPEQQGRLLIFWSEVGTTSGRRKCSWTRCLTYYWFTYIPIMLFFHLSYTVHYVWRFPFFVLNILRGNQRLMLLDGHHWVAQSACSQYCLTITYNKKCHILLHTLMEQTQVGWQLKVKVNGFDLQSRLSLTAKYLNYWSSGLRYWFNVGEQASTIDPVSHNRL